MIKKAISSILSAVLLVAFLATPVLAQNSDDAVMTRGALCGNCGRGEIVTKFGSWGEWRKISTVTCIHYAHGQDEIYMRTREITYKCPYCGDNWVEIGSETKRECHGWNG